MGREEHCRQMSPACVGSARSVRATLGVPSSTTCVPSQFTLLKLQAALQGNRLKGALGCVHFPGVSHSGSGSQVLHKGTDSAGPAICALPRSKQLGRPGGWRAHSSQLGGASYLLRRPSRSVSWCTAGAPSLVCRVSPLISGCDPPGGCQLSRIPGRLG